MTMKLEQQVCTLEQAKTLKKLGINQPTLFVWLDYSNNPHGPKIVHTEVVEFESERDYIYAAPTVAELGVMLPGIVGCKNGLNDDYFLCSHKGKSGWYVEYRTNKKDLSINGEGELDRPVGYLFNTFRSSFNYAESMASYLILLLENNLTTAKEVNQRLNA